MDIILIKLSVTNCFLVKAGERYVLIDTGYEEDWSFFSPDSKKAVLNYPR